MNDATERLREFLATYGERGYYLLKAMLETSRSLIGVAKLGDFDFKSVRRKLREYGLDYNPAILLSKLEKDYYIIETSYKSSNQHWWRIIDENTLEDVIREHEGRPPQDPDDPKLRILRIQFYSLNPDGLLETLKKLENTRKLGWPERRILRKLAFEELPLLAEFLDKAREQYPEELAREITLAEAILETAEAVVVRALGARGLEVLKPRTSATLKAKLRDL